MADAEGSTEKQLKTAAGNAIQSWRGFSIRNQNSCMDYESTFS
jgi:hypothetical protein